MSDLLTSRKADHLRLALEAEVEVPAGAAGWDAVRLIHQALPELALADVDTTVELMGKRLAFPLIVGSMTGGTDEAGEVNRRLARAAARAGIGMGLGSQRVMLHRPETAATFAVKDAAPDLPLLIANLGAVQLGSAGRVQPAALRGLADRVGADAVVLHLNAAQEAVQPEGDTDFARLGEIMAAVAGEVGLPVGLKEVGAGFSIAAVKRLAASPYRWAFIESAGRGGTSWTLIEGLRSGLQAKVGAPALGELFADWGIPSVTSCLACVAHGGGIPVIASGGLRSGLDGARALACGAAVTAMALPLLKAAAESEDAAFDAMMAFRDALRVAMFLTGARTVADLRRVPRRVHPDVWPECWEGVER
ncbi:MAG: type 2 isopentenyl-diphosphate Delta-isomerase [Myxococcota bacterium]